MSRGRTALLALALALVGFAAHAPSLGYGFVFDEKILILENPAVHNLADWKPLLLQKFWPGPVRGVYYRPTITLSYALNYAIAGGQPWIYHLTNVIAHALASALAFLLLLRLTRRPLPALIAASIFAVHPIHPESVTWVPGRTDVFAALFLIAAWLMLLVRRERKTALARAALAPGFWALTLLALGAKELALVLPLLVLAADLALLPERRLRYWADYLELCGLNAIMVAVRARALAGPGSDPSPDPLFSLPVIERVAKIGAVFGQAGRDLLFPGGWRIDYAYETSIMNASSLVGWIGVAFVILLLAAAIVVRKKAPELTLAAFGFVISMLPMSHLLPFPAVFAERFLYLPSLFYSLAFGAILARLFSGRARDHAALATLTRPAPVLVALAGLLVFLLAHGVARGQAFRDDLSFWSAAVRSAPDRAVVHNMLGVAYRDRDLLEQAREEFATALKLDASFHASAMNLAEIQWRSGDREGAVASLLMISRQAPDPKVLFNLGSFQAELGQWDAAAQSWVRALGLDPGFIPARRRLAHYWLVIKKDCHQAKAQLEAAKRDDPNHALTAEMEEKISAGCGWR